MRVGRRPRCRGGGLSVRKSRSFLRSWTNASNAAHETTRERLNLGRCLVACTVSRWLRVLARSAEVALPDFELADVAFGSDRLLVRRNVFRLGYPSGIRRRVRLPRPRQSESAGARVHAEQHEAPEESPAESRPLGAVAVADPVNVEMLGNLVVDPDQELL